MGMTWADGGRAGRGVARGGRGTGDIGWAAHADHHPPPPSPPCRRVPVAQHVDAHVQQAGPHVVGVVPQRHQLLRPPRAAVGAGEHAQGADHLLGRGGRHGGGLEVGGGHRLQVGDDVGRRRYVAAGRAERLCKGAHHDVDVGGVDAQGLAHAAPRRAQGPDGVGFVQVQVRLVPACIFCVRDKVARQEEQECARPWPARQRVRAVGQRTCAGLLATPTPPPPPPPAACSLLLDFHNLGQARHLALHRVDAFHDDDHLFPRPPAARLAVGQGGPQHRLQVVGVVVRKHLAGVVVG